jgi:hypothetical protein
MDEEGNSGVPFFLSLAVCIRALCVIVVLPFFFPFKVKVFFLCCLSCFFNIWLLTENKEDNNRKKTKMKKKTRGKYSKGKNDVNNPQGPAVNSQVTRSRDDGSL